MHLCVCVPSPSPSPSEGVCVYVCANAHTGLPKCAGAVPRHRQDHIPFPSDLRCVCVCVSQVQVQVQVQLKVFVYLQMLIQAFPDVQEQCLTKDKVTSLPFLT